MATADVVTVRLEAETAGYLRDIKRADAQFTTSINHINSQAPRAAGAMNGLAGQVGNVGAQFQDIGVQLAGGQSPLLIALQQGTQLSAVLQSTANPVRALGAAFASIISPVSLVTIATIALGGAALQYFGSILGEGRDSTEVIKEQNDLIRRVAENWGEAVPSLRAYVDQLDRAAQATDTAAAFDVLVGEQFEPIIAQLDDIRVGFVDARVSLQQFGAEASVIDNLQSEFDGLVQKVRDNTVTTEDLERMQALLADTVGSDSIPALVSLGGVLQQLSSALAAAAANTATLRSEQAALRDANAQVEAFQTNQEFLAEQERLNGLTAEQLALEREVARVKAEAGRGDVLISEQQALSLAQQRLAAEERRRQLAGGSGGGTGGGGASEAERERQAVLDLIDALMFEQSLLGMTSAEKAVQNALRRAGAAATDEERATIEELITATYAQQDAIRAAEQAQRAFENIATQSLTTFIQDLRAGKSAAEALSNVFDNIANQLIQMAVQGLVKAAFGGLFGGGGGGLFGGLFGGFRAHGGSVQQGKGYMVGERGPEPFFPTTSGRILPNSALQDVGGGGGEVVVYIQSGEMFDATVQTISGRVASRVVSSGIASYDRNLSSRMVEQNARGN